MFVAVVLRGLICNGPVKFYAQAPKLFKIIILILNALIAAQSVS